MSVTSSGSAAVGNLRRVVVGFKSPETNSITLANFVDCVVKHFNPNDKSAQLSFKLENNLLILSPPLGDQQKQEDNSTRRFASSFNSEFSSVVLEHSPACPFMHMDGPSEVLPEEKLNQGIFVGVVIILESSDEHILITQRADHMRTFPKSWVPPGGHIETGETLFEGGLRELREETGLDLNALRHRAHPLCMWESVYPPYLGLGNPRNHHIVVYIHATVEEPWNQLQERIKLDEQEVQGCVWLSRAAVASICSGSKAPLPVDKYITGPGGRLVAQPFDLSGLFPITVPGKRYSGLQSALHRWLRAKEPPPPCKM